MFYVSHLSTILWQERIAYRFNYDYVFSVPDQEADLDRILKTNNNVFVNQRRTDKQW